MLTPQRYFELVPPTVDMTIRSELYHTNEFNFAVAVILSAQATDKKVNEVTPTLFRIAPTPQKMLELGIDGLKKHIKANIVTARTHSCFANNDQSQELSFAFCDVSSCILTCND